MDDWIKETVEAIITFFETVGPVWGFIIVTAVVLAIMAVGVLIQNGFDRIFGRRNRTEVTYLYGRWHDNTKRN